MTILAKSVILDVWQHPKGASKNVPLITDYPNNSYFFIFSTYNFGVTAGRLCDSSLEVMPTSFGIRIIKSNFFTFYFIRRN